MRWILNRDAAAPGTCPARLGAVIGLAAHRAAHAEIASARLFGCDAVVYLPAHVTGPRAEAIRSFGARVVRVEGEYDDAVARAGHDARSNGWTVISDTSYPGYMDIPRVVMAGYTVMVDEVMRHVRASPPTHVFIQGGVGGLAAAVIGHLWERLGEDRPVAVIVEPGEPFEGGESGVANLPCALLPCAARFPRMHGPNSFRCHQLPAACTHYRNEAPP